MLRKVIFCALASAAMIPTAAAAQGRGGGHGNSGGDHGAGPTGVSGGMGNAGGKGANLGRDIGGMGSFGGRNVGIEQRNASRINSPNTVTERGNSSSLRAGTSGGTATAAGLDRMFAGTRTTTTVTSGALTGLTTGMTLRSNGTAIGTVQQIRTRGNGSVAVVIVQGTNGGLFAVPANKLTLSGGTLSTTARFAGINGSSQARLNSQGPLHASPTGIAHANFRSVLASGMVVSGSLAGLTTGLTVNTSTGTTLGTVSQIVTDTSGNIRLVIVTSSTGQTFRLAPTNLSLSGGVVTTTQTFG